MTEQNTEIQTPLGREASDLTRLLSGVFAWFPVWGHLIALVFLLLQGAWLASWFCFAAAWFAFDARMMRKLLLITSAHAELGGGAEL